MMPKNTLSFREKTKAIVSFLAIVGGSCALAVDSVVVFNEIHYHPEADDTALEYIELYNQLATDIDISNWRIDGDVKFDLPEGTILGGGEYLVIAKDPATLNVSGALGPYEGRLSNSGDPVILYNNNRAFRSLPGGTSAGTASSRLEGRRIMDILDYSDTFPWPIAPDGSGFSLAKKDPATGTAHPTNWAVSTQVNGTPGFVNTFVGLPSLSINELTATTAANFQIELHNFGSVPLDLSGMVIASSDPLHSDYVLPPANLAAGGFLSINAATLGFTPADNNRLFLYTTGKTSVIDAVRADDAAQARQPDGTGRWLRPDTLTFGAVNQFSINDSIVINEIFYHAPALSPTAATLGNLETVRVLDFSSNWRYNLDAGAAGLSADWASSAHAVDGVSWAEGAGLLGVESSTLGELILTEMTLSSKIPYYFETEFIHDGSDPVTKLNINHYLDDGAVFFLNGVEIGRFNMPTGVVTPSTLASAVGNATLNTLTVQTPNVLNGSNRLSVQVHQSTTGSSDLVFGAQVELTKSTGGTAGTAYQTRDEEWLELYNRGDSTVDLTGWKVSGGIGYDFPVGTTIAPGAFLVLAEDPSALAVKHPTITILGDYSGTLANGGDEIILEDSVGNPVDEVTYFDSRKWHRRADGGGSSLELLDPDSDNSVAGAWAASDEAARNTWQTYTYEGIAEDDNIGLTTFNELQIGLLDAGEFLIDDLSVIENDSTEFIQNRDFEGDAIGATPDKWRVIGTHGSHGNTIVITDPDDAGNKCLRVVATGPTENKHNKIETTFANNETVVIGNTYRISFRAKHIGGSAQLNSRLYFNYLQRTSILDTAEIWGTPGATNSSAVSNAGPTVENLSHSPVVPSANQAVTVQATASDSDGVSSVTLNYSINGGSFQTAAMTAGGNGRYSGTIPGQSASAIVRFYVSATDSASAVGTYPAAGSGGGAFYKVQDGLADTTGLRPNFRIVMAESDRTFLFQTTNRMSNDRMAVTVIDKEEVAYYDVALRLKASAVGRTGSSTYGFTMRFQPDQLFRGVHPTVSVERGGSFNDAFVKHLHNHTGNPYTTSYDDIAYIITPTTNDRGMGLLHMARHTATFFNSIHPNASEEGTLFNLELHYSPTSTTDGNPESLKIPRPISHITGQYDLKDRGDDKEPYRWGYQIRSARDRDDYAKIIALNQAFELDGAALESAVLPLIDIDQWMEVFAMMILNGTDDVFSRIWEHNFRYYVQPDNGKIVVMQWDMDRSFRLSTSNANTILPSVNRQGTPVQVAKLLAIPRFERLLHAYIDDLIKTTFNSTYSAPLAANISTVSGASVSTFATYVTNRANLVDNILPANIPFAVTTNNGNDFAEANSSVELEGDGWVDVFSIQVNGIETPITWTDSDSWLIEVPVNIGVNNVTLTAFNNHGVEVGTDFLEITNTSTTDLASVGNTVISELHYNPTGPSVAEMAAGFLDKDDFEFVELTNISVGTIDLTSVSFTDGIAFTFAAGELLNPGESIVVVSNLAAFEQRYGVGAVRVAGAYIGSFKNSSEYVRLEAADTTVISDFTYNDDFPWPESADGDGFSLVYTGTAPDEASDWRPSVSIGGTPGGSDSIPYSGNDLLAYALASPPSVSFSGSSFQIEFSQNLAADDADICVQFSTDLVTWSTGSDSVLASSVNQGDGTRRMIYSPPVTMIGAEHGFVRLQVKLR